MEHARSGESSFGLFDAEHHWQLHAPPLERAGARGCCRIAVVRLPKT
jgi:hypothetical protein